MLKKEEFLDRIELSLESLVKNAQQLKDLSSGVISEEELQVLQDEQEEMIADLTQLGVELKKQHGIVVNELTTEKGRILQKKIQKFQELNTGFYNNISIRKSILQRELEELRKTQQSIVEIKNSYIKKNNQSSRRSTINTLS